MDEKKLLLFAVAWSLIGIFLLSLIIYSFSPPHIKIKQLQNFVGKEVIISGKVEQEWNKNNIHFLTVSDGSGKINVIVFKNLNKNLLGSMVEIRGIVKIYGGNLEIQALQILEKPNQAAEK